MKQIRKSLAIALAACMLLTNAVSAFAAEAPELSGMKSGETVRKLMDNQTV